MGTEDAGSYHCVAENVLGQAEVSTKKVSRVKSNLKKIYQRKNQFVYEQCPRKEETNNARGVFIEVHQGGTRLSTAKESYHQSWGANSIIRLLGTQTNCSMTMWQT